MTDDAAATAAALRRAVASPQLAHRAAASLDAVTPRPREAGINRFPASPGQERLYDRQELALASATHLVPFLARIKGRLQVDALRTALTRVVDRHEVLRTGFELDPELGLTQVVHPAETLPIDFLTDEIHGDDVPGRFAELTSQPFPPAGALANRQETARSRFRIGRTATTGP